MKNVLSAICLLAVLAGFSQERRIEFEEFDLDNGLHVILHQDNSTPIIVISSFYLVGSKDEEIGKTGFAHFFEHVASRKSTNIPVGGFTDYISEAGGARNATTDFDRTYYYELLPSNQLELGLWIESERMFNMIVDTSVVETEREVVKEERRLRTDNRPYGRLVEEILKRSFKEHHYQWPVIGSIADLNAASIQDFEDFKNTYYVPNNATLTIAGDIDIAKTKELVNLYFGEFEKGKAITRQQVVEPEQTVQVVDTVYDNVQLPAMVMAFHVPAAGTKDYYSMNMLNQILSAGSSSRLNRKLVDETQLAVAAGAFDFATQDPGISIAFGIANVGVDLSEVRVTIEDEIKKLQTELVPEKEFQKAMNQIENNFISGNSTMAGIAQTLAYNYAIRNNTNLINTELEQFLAVTPQDVMDAAKKYLTPENSVVLYWLPTPN